MFSPTGEVSEFSFPTVTLEKTFIDSIISEDYVYDSDDLVERTCIGIKTFFTMEEEVRYGRLNLNVIQSAGGKLYTLIWDKVSIDDWMDNYYATFELSYHFGC